MDDEALKRVIRSQPIPDKLLRDLRRTPHLDPGEPPPDPPSLARRRERPKLSPAEWKVLSLTSHGLTYEMIGDTLGKSPFTVQDQLKKVRYVLRAKNTVHAVAIALRLGLID